MSLWRYLFGCRHDAMLRRRGTDGRLYLCCFDCGHTVPALRDEA